MDGAWCPMACRGEVGRWRRRRSSGGCAHASIFSAGRSSNFFLITVSVSTRLWELTSKEIGAQFDLVLAHCATHQEEQLESRIDILVFV